jgi:aldehyde:ferredoxin oxidoreductase
MGLRHSHLDTGGYSFDQKHETPEIDKTLKFLVEDEAGRVLLTSMVSCLFARGVYQDDLLRECLSVVGYGGLADRMDEAAKTIQRLRWRVRLQTGFDPSQVKIPRRFYEVETWKGKIDADRLDELVRRYGAAVSELGQADSEAADSA